MWLRIVLFLSGLAGLGGCSGTDPVSTSASKSQAQESLPPEVTGDPESALPKQKAVPRN